jgi:hypothetical protein
MRRSRKACWGALLCLPVLFLAGCSGINSSYSVSPASFFLPGLMRLEPPKNTPTAPQPGETPASELALAR